jgi:hypothetical protein
MKSISAAMFVCSGCLFDRVDLELCKSQTQAGGTPKIARSLARNTPSQILCEIPRPIPNALLG